MVRKTSSYATGIEKDNRYRERKEWEKTMPNVAHHSFLKMNIWGMVL